MTAPVQGTLPTGKTKHMSMMLTPLAKAINMKATSFVLPEVIEGQLHQPYPTTTILSFLDG
jgi:hypothetical protein